MNSLSPATLFSDFQREARAIVKGEGLPTPGTTLRVVPLFETLKVRVPARASKLREAATCVAFRSFAHPPRLFSHAPSTSFQPPRLALRIWTRLLEP